MPGQLEGGRVPGAVLVGESDVVDGRITFMRRFAPAIGPTSDCGTMALTPGGRYGWVVVADVDGLTRKVASTGPSDGLVTWSADATSLFYLDMVPRADGMYDGATIQQHMLATGTTRQVLYAVPLLSFFPSPDGSRVALAIARSDYGEGPVAIVMAVAPQWQPGPASELTYSGRYTAMAWEDAAVLRVAEVVVGDFLKVTRFGADGQVLDTAQYELDSPPAGIRYSYARPLLSRNGRRILVSRHASDAVKGLPTGPRQHFVFDGATRHVLEAREDLEAIGWSDERRILFLSGFYQGRRPVLLDPGPVTP